MTVIFPSRVMIYMYITLSEDTHVVWQQLKASRIVLHGKMILSQFPMCKTPVRPCVCEHECIHMCAIFGLLIRVSMCARNMHAYWKYMHANIKKRAVCCSQRHMLSVVGYMREYVHTWTHVSLLEHVHAWTHVSLESTSTHEHMFPLRVRSRMNTCFPWEYVHAWTHVFLGLKTTALHTWIHTYMHA